MNEPGAAVTAWRDRADVRCGCVVRLPVRGHVDPTGGIRVLLQGAIVIGTSSSGRLRNESVVEWLKAPRSKPSKGMTLPQFESLTYRHH